MTTTEFKGQVALVTGASRGIGAAIALDLAKQGLTVIGTATTDEGAARISDALAAYSGCRGANLNVNDAAAGEALIEEIVKSQGGLHVLVNNAGITRDTLAMRMKDDDWDAVLDTNLKAVFRMSRAVMRPMMNQRTQVFAHGVRSFFQSFHNSWMITPSVQHAHRLGALTWKNESK